MRKNQNYRSINSDLQSVKGKTTFIIEPASSDGTVFRESVYADKFIISGATSANKAFLMSDGTLTTNSSIGEPNIYLYTNSNTTPANEPASGQIRTNNGHNSLSTHIYVSDNTRDGTNIEVFLGQISNISIIYLQDQNVSSNWVRYTVIGTLTYVNYIDIEVTYLSSSGAGSSDFGNGHPIFMQLQQLIQ